MQFSLDPGLYSYGPVLISSRPLLFGLFTAGLWLVATRSVAFSLGFSSNGVLVFPTKLHALGQHIAALRMFGASCSAEWTLEGYAAYAGYAV